MCGPFALFPIEVGLAGVRPADKVDSEGLFDMNRTLTICQMWMRKLLHLLYRIMPAPEEQHIVQRPHRSVAIKYIVYWFYWEAKHYDRRAYDQDAYWEYNALFTNMLMISSIDQPMDDYFKMQIRLRGIKIELSQH